MTKKWNHIPTPEETALHLRECLGIHHSLCKILAQRNIDSFEMAKSFFRPRFESLHDPFLMKGMDVAIHRIQSAAMRGERILLIGDYDVDGTTSVALLYNFLTSHYGKIAGYYIPNRYKEGYGISKKAIDFAISHKYSLIISLDCGIKAIELIGYAKEFGIDCIVCDHHLPGKSLPPAYAILNPKQSECNYPYKDLCGCGITFKLVQALASVEGISEDRVLRFLDLVALATVADIVPLTGENRILTYFGIRRMKEAPCAGIKALLDCCEAGDRIDTYCLGFLLAPRINAAGRMDEGYKAVQLFTCNSYDDAIPLASELHKYNVDRKDVDNKTTLEALDIINQDAELIKRKTTVVFRGNWHKGVVGIVASRLIESYYRPTIVLTMSEGVITGSARSIEGFNVYEAIDACRDHLLGYGGHFAAAGMTLRENQLQDFITKFEETVATTIDPDLLIPQINIDAEIRFADISFTYYNIIEQMEPFGPENLPPVFLSTGVVETGYSTIVKEKHVRFVFKQDNCTFSGIGFNMADKFELLQKKSHFNIVYHLEKNEYNNIKSIQLRILDIR